MRHSYVFPDEKKAAVKWLFGIRGSSSEFWVPYETATGEREFLVRSDVEIGEDDLAMLSGRRC